MINRAVGLHINFLGNIELGVSAEIQANITKSPPTKIKKNVYAYQGEYFIDIINAFKVTMIIIINPNKIG